MRLIPLLLLSLLGIADARAESLPQDARDFVERRDLCDHFRGEEPYDAERAAFLRDATRKHCTGTDRELAALRHKYADDATVTAALADYETTIEPSPLP